MIFSNYHTHCSFCDGTNAPEDYIDHAVKCGWRDLGFSSHAPLPYPTTLMAKENLNNYFTHLCYAKKFYAKKINILFGLEIDYIPGVMKMSSPQYDFCDYKIGSVHYLDFLANQQPYPIDRSKEVFCQGLLEVFQGDLTKACQRYYGLVRQMVREEQPDIVGHLDKIKRHIDNYLAVEEEAWYQEEIIKTLATIRDSKSIIEVNTRGLHNKVVPCLYPSRWILELIKKFNIPIVINSDAHSPAELSQSFDEVEAIVATLGFQPTNKNLFYAFI